MRFQVVQFGDYDFRVRFQHQRLLIFPYWKWGQGVNAFGEIVIMKYESPDEAKGKAEEFLKELNNEKVLPRVVYDSNSELPPHKRRLPK